ncbi:MAG: metallophosphoesterase [Planctomycetes bacterium]|nr:metallophosphoesterase [Planctomycetota bacterium]
MKRILLFALLSAGACGGGEDSVAAPGGFAFAVLTDLHIGEGFPSYEGQEDERTTRARQAVARINALVARERIAFVFVLGDLTDSAEESELTRVREILDGLTVPYYPLMGNHDTWPYTATSEAPLATGDERFQTYFGDRLAGLTRPDNPVWNPEVGTWSYFQNFELRYQNYLFLGLDWASRQGAPLGNKGGHAQADVHDFPGGTYRWLVERLAQRPESTRKIFFLQHHPFRVPPGITAFAFAFSADEKTRFKDALLAAGPRELYWGCFAGHFHWFRDVSAFDDWTEFRQWETDACKDSAAVTLVRIGSDGSIIPSKL